MSQSQQSVVLVSGATGNVGAATVKTLAAKYGEQVKILAGVRDEFKATKSFDGVKNIELIKYDTNQTETLDDALQGVHSLYIIPPNPGSNVNNRHKSTLAQIAAAKKNGVKFVLLLDVIVSEDNKFIFGREWNEYIDLLKSSDIPYARLVTTMFAENLWGSVGSLKDQSAFYFPVHGDVAWNYITVDDVGAASAAILADSSKHAGKVYTITGPTLTTNNGIAAELSKLTGRTINFYQATAEQAIDALTSIGFPKFQAQGIIELWDMYTAGTGKGQLISNDYYILTGKQATDMKEWIKQLVPAIKQ